MAFLIAPPLVRQKLELNKSIKCKQYKEVELGKHVRYKYVTIKIKWGEGAELITNELISAKQLSSIK